MKIIEIRKTTDGEVAYVLDQGRIIKLPVEDQTGYNRYENQLEEREPAPQRPVRQPQPVYEDEIIEDDEPIEEMPPRPQRPVQQRRQVRKPKSIMPPGVASIFTQPGRPGAAEERRDVG